MQPPPTPNWLTTMPKVELHCHLDMMVDPAMLRTLEQGGQRLPLRADALAAAYPVRSYEDFWKWGAVAEALEGSLDHFKPVLALHAERLKAQHVIYAEVMIGSSELPRDRSELLDRMQEFRAFVNTLEDQMTQIEFLVVVGRNRPPERVAEVAERVLVLHRAGLLAGIAVAGPEAGNPIRPLRATLERLHAEGVGIEVHAGEWAGPDSVWDALEHGFPDRIGHGVAAFREPALVDELLKRGVHVEFCPTSK